MHAAILRYIDQVARLGSIRRAAAVLNISSSAVNRQILNLEAELGTPLFERVGNGVRPTAAGQSVIQHARDTLAMWQAIKAGASAQSGALSGDIRGEVRIISIPAPFVRLLPRAIEATARQHPHIGFHLIDATPIGLAEEMRAGRPDVAIKFIDRRQRGYVVAARIRLRLGAIMRPDHPLAGRTTTTLTECAAHPVCLMNDPWLLDAVAEAEFTSSGAEFRSRVNTNSLHMSKAMLRAGVCLGFFTPAGFVDELKAGDLVHVPLDEPELSGSELGLLVHRERQGLPAVHAVVAELQAHFTELGRDIAGLARPPD